MRRKAYKQWWKEKKKDQRFGINLKIVTQKRRQEIDLNNIYKTFLFYFYKKKIKKIVDSEKEVLAKKRWLEWNITERNYWTQCPKNEMKKKRKNVVREKIHGTIDSVNKTRLTVRKRHLGGGGGE